MYLKANDGLISGEDLGSDAIAGSHTNSILVHQGKVAHWTMGTNAER